MSDFDPDAYLNDKMKAAFDPDEYLKAKRAPPSAARSALIGFAQGGTFNVAPKIGGLAAKLFDRGGVKLGKAMQISKDDTPELRAIKEEALRAEAERPTMYEMTRDLLTEEDKAAQEAHPWAYGAGNLAGAVAVPVPGGSTLRAGSTLARLGKGALTGAGMGTLSALGASEADDLQGYGKDALRGATWGAGGGTVAAGLGVGVDKLAARALRGKQKAVADALAKKTATAQKAEDSALGSYRSGIQSASRDLEVLERIAEGSDDLAWEASGYLGTPKAQAVREMVGRGKLESAPERIDDVERLLAELAEARKGTDPLAVQKATADYLAHPIKYELVPRAKTWAARAIPVAVGSTVGGAPGAMLGTAVANQIGKPTTAMANAMQSPAMRNLLWGILRGGTAGIPHAGPLAHPFERSLERGLSVLAPASDVQSKTKEAKEREKRARRLKELLEQ